MVYAQLFYNDTLPSKSKLVQLCPCSEKFPWKLCTVCLHIVVQRPQGPVKHLIATMTDCISDWRCYRLFEVMASLQIAHSQTLCHQEMLRLWMCAFATHSTCVCQLVLAMCTTLLKGTCYVFFVTKSALFSVLFFFLNLHVRNDYSIPSGGHVAHCYNACSSTTAPAKSCFHSPIWRWVAIKPEITRMQLLISIWHVGKIDKNLFLNILVHFFSFYAALYIKLTLQATEGHKTVCTNVCVGRPCICSPPRGFWCLEECWRTAEI